MTIEEFKEEFLKEKIRIFTKTKEEAETVIRTIVKLGIARGDHKSDGTYAWYDVNVYPYVIYHNRNVTAYRGVGGPISDKITTTLSADECLQILSGIYEHESEIDISELM